MKAKANAAAGNGQDNGFEPSTELNMALLDPNKYGWSVVGGVRDILPPHEVSEPAQNRSKQKKTERRTRKRLAIGWQRHDES